MSSEKIEGINWQTIHDNIFSKLMIRKKAKKDAIDAANIEKFLRRIKSYDLNSPKENIIKDTLDQEAKDIIMSSFNMLNLNRDSKHKLLDQKLFYRVHGTSVSYGGDDIFEEELAAVIASIENYATNSQSASISSKLVGSQSTNVLLTKSIDPLLQEALTQLNATIKKKVEDIKETPFYTKPVARSGKTDVNGTSLQVQAQINPEWDKLFTLFQGRTFTVKNYSSLSSLREIHLGNTDFFKATYGVLNAAGYGQKYIEKILFKGINSNNSIINAHLYHMRFIYELRGEGLYDAQGQPLTGTDFFIYNDPSSNAIYVRSTAQMILNYLDSIKTSNKIPSGISIPKVYFQNDLTS